jgi:ABC-type dipeptide/oligopeptide/nickel transport system permease subunit
MATMNAVTKLDTGDKGKHVSTSLLGETIKNLLRNRSAVAGLGIIGIVAVIAIAAPLLAPYDPIQSMIGQPGHTGRLPARPPCIHLLGCPLEEPEHLMGLDKNARDLFSRLLYGSWQSLRVGTLSVMFAIITGSLMGLFAGFNSGAAQGESVNFFGYRLSMVGWRRPVWCIVFPILAVWDRHILIKILVLVGMIAGYLPGIFLALIFVYPDETIMRSMDVLLAFPSLLLAIAIVTVLGPGLENALLAVALVSIPVYARLARASVLSIKEMEYVLAVTALGAGSNRILFRHVLPNAVTPLIVQGTLGIGTAILDAAALSFLGLGAQPPTPEWGAMLSEGRNDVFTSPHLVFFPGIAIMITVLGFNLLGDGMRDAFDPRLNRN